jgi:tetratricopeptide (TPR) repeat protein
LSRIASYREAIRLKPAFANAHNGLGNALKDKGRPDDAIAAYREAIRLEPDFAIAHNNLGNALIDKGRLDDAIAAYREAIRLKPDSYWTFFDLGRALASEGRFEESLAQFERGHEIGSKQPGWQNRSVQWVDRARRMVGLDKTFPAFLRGEIKPADNAERLALAYLCYKKRLHGAAARFYTEALENQPDLATDLRTGSRYDAACAASLAASGEGKDEPALDEVARRRWRQQALDLLSADLALWSKELGEGTEKVRAEVVRTLLHWKIDADLVGLRDEAPPAGLPEEDRKACRALWGAVNALIKQALGPPRPAQWKKKLGLEDLPADVFARP